MWIWQEFLLVVRSASAICFLMQAGIFYVLESDVFAVKKQIKCRRQKKNPFYWFDDVILVLGFGICLGDSIAGVFWQSSEFLVWWDKHILGIASFFFKCVLWSDSNAHVSSGCWTRWTFIWLLAITVVFLSALDFSICWHWVCLVFTLQRG